jgi:hypothetical protein
MKPVLLRAVLLILQVVVVAWSVNRFMQWFRSHSSAARERAIYKQRLPNWIKSFEMWTFSLLFPLSFLGLFLGTYRVHALLHQHVTRQPSSIAMPLLIVPDFFFAGMLTFFVTNFIESIVPAMKTANDKAAEGLPAASFHQTTKDLVKVLEWAGTFCLMLWVLGFTLE